MADSQLVISAEESAFLVQLLENALHNKLVEEHRTERAAYREAVHAEIELIESLSAKLRNSSIEVAGAVDSRQTPAS